MSASIRISYERAGRCFWHLDCANHFGGVMRLELDEPNRSLLRCLHCGAGGWYPLGAVGERCCASDERASASIKLEQRGRITLICSNAEVAVREAIARQFPMGWTDGWVPPMYADEMPKRLRAGEIVRLGACDRETVWMYPAHFRSAHEATLS